MLYKPPFVVFKNKHRIEGDTFSTMIAYSVHNKGFYLQI